MGLGSGTEADHDMGVVALIWRRLLVRLATDEA